MTTHPVPIGRLQLLAGVRRLRDHGRDIDDQGQALDASSVDGDPYDRPDPATTRPAHVPLMTQLIDSATGHAEQARAWWERHGLHDLMQVRADDIIAAVATDHAEALAINTPAPALPVRVPGEALQRVTAIDALYRLAAFYEDNPDVPTPHHIVASSDVTTTEQVAAFAEACGGKPYAGGHQYDHSITNLHDTGVWAMARVAYHGPDRPL